MKFTIMVDINHKIYLHEDLTGETFEQNLDVEIFESIQVKNTEDHQRTAHF